VPLEVRAPIEEMGLEPGWFKQCREAEIEGTYPDSDRVHVERLLARHEV
jgi:hypothetical protein